MARTGLGLELPYMVGLGLPNLEVRSKLFIIKSIVENSRIILCLHLTLYYTGYLQLLSSGILLMTILWCKYNFSIQ